MELIKIAAQKGSKFIKADDLDKNFAMLTPKTNGTYGINESSDGYDLNILPKYPDKMQSLHFLVYNPAKIVNSDKDIKGLQWIAKFLLNAVDFLLSINTDKSAVKRGAVLAAVGNGRVEWIVPPEGLQELNISWQEVERCDGKKMYVLGTEWAD